MTQNREKIAMPYAMSDSQMEAMKLRLKRELQEHSAQSRSTILRRQIIRYTAACAACATLAVGAFSFVALEEKAPQEEFLAEVHSAPADILFDMSQEAAFYDEENI